MTWPHRLLAAVVAVALPLLPARAAQAQPGDLVYAVTAAGQLALLSLDQPDAPPLELGSIRGLAPGEAIRSIDVRATDGALIALAAASDGSLRTYRLATDPSGTFGAASPLGSVSPPTGPGDLDVDPCTGAPTVRGVGSAYSPPVRLLGGWVCLTQLRLLDTVDGVLSVVTDALGAVLPPPVPVGPSGRVVGYDIGASGQGLVATESAVPARASTVVELSILSPLTGGLQLVGRIGLAGVVAVAIVLLAPGAPVPQAPWVLVVPVLVGAVVVVERRRSRSTVHP